MGRGSGAFFYNLLLPGLSLRIRSESHPQRKYLLLLSPLTFPRHEDLFSLGMRSKIKDPQVVQKS